METVKGKVRLFCAGGAGMNIGKNLEVYRGVNEPGRAELFISYVDTSRSNFDDRVDQDSVYLIDGLDGSGKIRRENYQAISERIRDILQNFPPMDLNIVVSSGSGGSGSVIAPSLVSELLLDNQPTIVILIGATDTRTDIDNTYKTIMSYDSVCKLREAPIPIVYLENSKNTPRAKVDETINQIISVLMFMYSRENSELDSRDLFNFLNFHRVSSYTPRLASLNMYHGTIPADVASSTITVASLYTSGADNNLEFKPEYQCVGYLADGVSEALKEITPIHFTTSANLFSAVVKNLKKELDDMSKAQKARIEETPITDHTTLSTGNGLIL